MFKTLRVDTKSDEQLLQKIGGVRSPLCQGSQFTRMYL